MNIDVIISADYVTPNKIKDKTVVVIDILRATSVIVTALKNGCKDVIPVLTVEEAKNIANKNRDNYILGGERNALKIDGFDCSNSPLEYTKDRVLGKTIVLTTTNGTKAINKSIGAKNILISALINAKSTSQRVVDINNDLVIINSGTYGEFSIDDFICSGYLIDCISNIKRDIVLSDIAKTAQFIYSKNKDIVGFMREASHYNRIKKLNLEKDLKYCMQKDITTIVPEYFNGRILDARNECVISKAF